MSGYVHCGCRDCFEIAVGEPGCMCHACEDAGCEADQACEAPHAYCEAEGTRDPELEGTDHCAACGQPW